MTPPKGANISQPKVSSFPLGPSHIHSSSVSLLAVSIRKSYDLGSIYVSLQYCLPLYSAKELSDIILALKLK